MPENVPLRHARLVSTEEIDCLRKSNCLASFTNHELEEVDKAIRLNYLLLNDRVHQLFRAPNDAWLDEVRLDRETWHKLVAASIKVMPPSLNIPLSPERDRQNRPIMELGILRETRAITARLGNLYTSPKAIAASINVGVNILTGDPMRIFAGLAVLLLSTADVYEELSKAELKVLRALIVINKPCSFGALAKEANINRGEAKNAAEKLAVRKLVKINVETVKLRERWLVIK